MVNLQIRQQFGRIGLDIKPLQYRLKTEPPDLRITQKPAQIELKQPVVTLNIDYTPAREVLGYNGIAAQLRAFVQEAKAAASAGIARRAVEGDRLGSIEKQISIAQVVKEATAPQERELQLVPVPPIKISFDIDPLQWDVIQPGGVTMNFTPGTVHGEFQYGTVHTFLEREPFITLDAVGNVFDQKV